MHREIGIACELDDIIDRLVVKLTLIFRLQRIDNSLALFIMYWRLPLYQVWLIQHVQSWVAVRSVRLERMPPICMIEWSSTHSIMMMNGPSSKQNYFDKLNILNLILFQEQTIAKKMMMSAISKILSIKKWRIKCRFKRIIKARF